MPVDPPVRAPFLSSKAARERAAAEGLSMEQLALDLLSWAKDYASAPISNYPVGAIAMGLSGAFYAGANLEFPGESLSFSVHAEQAAVYNAWAHGETGVTLIATSAPPCGYCRQFLNELAAGGKLRVLIPGRAPVTLAALLPEAFGPPDVGNGGRLMQPATRSLSLPDTATDAGGAAAGDPVAAAALAAASAAYAPYSGTYAGVGLRTADGSVYQGRYAENAAFNPSLSPLQGALISLTLAGGTYAAIEDAALVEASEPSSGRLQHTASQRATTVAILAAVAPNVRLRYLAAQPAGTAATVQASDGLDSTDTSALS